MSEAPLRVLVVDDDEEDYLILRDLLADYAQEKFNLDWVGTLREGIDALRAQIERDREAARAWFGM